MYMKKLKIMAMVVTLMCFAGCATLGLDIKDMQPKDYVTIAMGVYIQQFDKHVEKSARTDLTAQEREDLQELKEALIAVYEPITLANLAISAGEAPTEANMKAIMDFLEKYYYKRR